MSNPPPPSSRSDLGELRVLPGAAAPLGADGVSRRLPIPPPIEHEATLPTPTWGMIAFLVSETAFFSTLIVAYLTFLRNDSVGPTPREVLSLSLVIGTTACLLSSSLTVHAAEGALRRGRQGSFRGWLLLTILLGVTFLAGTAYEWWDLIENHGLTISRNLFGSTFYTLVGFHGLHVTGGLIALSTILGLALRNRVTQHHEGGMGSVVLYWHFVDGVWVVVFLVVYVFGR